MVSSSIPSPRAAIYARQSTTEDQGIAQQVEDCRREASRRGWTVAEVFDKDNDTSASKARSSKTDWVRMLKAFDNGRFDALIVTETSRLTRNLVDVLDVTAPRRDMRVIVTREGVDTDVDDYPLKQLVLFAEREVRVKAQRARRYAVERRKSGHPTAGKVPYGYRWIPNIERDANGHRYAIVDTEAAIVKRVFGEFLTGGASLGQIARDLNTSGSLTRAGARWGSPSVRRLLLNPVYAALLVPTQETGTYDAATINLEDCEPGAWDAIVSFDELAAARARLVHVKPSHKGTARKWLLSGLAVCSVCREPVRSARGETHPTARVDGSGAAERKRYHTYRCVNSHLHRNGDLIDEFVAEICIGRLARPDSASLFPAKDTGPDLAALNAQRIELEGREATIAGLIATGKMKPAAAEQALEKLAVLQREVNTQIAEAATRDPLSELIGVTDVRSYWRTATLARRRTLIDTLMTVVIKPIGAGKRVRTMWDVSESVDLEWKR